MTKILGFEKFAAQGGDWGAGVASLIGQKYPSSVCGIHLNLLFAPRDKITGGNSEGEARYGERLAHWLREESGYQQIQGTKPQTLAFGLTDSPARSRRMDRKKNSGTWSDNDGVPERPYSRDRMCEYCSLLVHAGDRFFVLAILWAPSLGLADLELEPMHCQPTGYAAFQGNIVPLRSRLMALSGTPSLSDHVRNFSTIHAARPAGNL